ncbi:MAG: DUF362 domain-containing protein [Deltaproteobacteria bacterium]|nr:DUF362 domain-containing protein [Deltaproteobacteria bacterium]
MNKIYHINAENKFVISQKVRDLLAAMNGLDRIVRPGHLVLIKPNFVAPFPRAATSLHVLEPIVHEVKNCGGHPVIVESSGYEFDTETTFKVLSVYEFGEKTGADIVNLDRAKFVNARLETGNVREVKIPEIVKEADVIINVPKIKRHSLTKVTLGIKNLFGLLHRDSRRKIHALGLERGILETARLIAPNLVIADGSTIAERAVYGAERFLGALVGGRDIYAVDMFCCGLLNVRWRDVPHIRFAVEQGLTDKDYEAVTSGPGVVMNGIDGAAKIENKVARQGLLKAAYQLMYLSDLAADRVFGELSLIPKIHFHMGIHPSLNGKKCTVCGLCNDVCPVSAIDLREKKINTALCMRVRCLKCVEACPESAITIRGRRVDKGLTA